MFRITDTYEQRDIHPDEFVVNHLDPWIEKHLQLPFRYGETLARCILFAGPRGNGKTTAVHYFAKRLGFTVLTEGCDLENLKPFSLRLPGLFAQASECQMLLHFEAVDSAFLRRDYSSNLTRLLAKCIKQYPDVVVIATCDDLNLVDLHARSALFKHEIYFDYLLQPERARFLRHLLRPHLACVDVDLVASNTHKYTMADLKHLVDMAVIGKLQDADQKVRTYHFATRPVDVVVDQQTLANCGLERGCNLMLDSSYNLKAVFNSVYSSYWVTSFPVVQMHFKYYFICQIDAYCTLDVIDFLEQAKLFDKIVVANGSPTLPMAGYFKKMNKSLALISVVTPSRCRRPPPKRKCSPGKRLPDVASKKKAPLCSN
jgi:hypothetical protein